MLGLCCWAQACSSCERGLPLVCVTKRFTCMDVCFGRCFLNSEPLEKSYINFLWTHSWCRGKALEQDVGSNPDSLADLWLGFILYFSSLICKMGFPGSWVGKESACSAEDLGSIPESGRSPGEGNGKPLQYSCLEKSHVQRSLVGYSPWDCKSRTRLSD